MKNLKFIALITISTFVMLAALSSCSNRRDGYFKHEVINTTFYVDEVHRAKYSKVEGHIFYNDIRVPIDNGNSGYYYNEYSLKPGDTLNSSIDIFYFSTYSGYELVFGDVDISRYEK